METHAYIFQKILLEYFIQILLDEKIYSIYIGVGSKCDARDVKARQNLKYFFSSFKISILNFCYFCSPKIDDFL